MRPLKSAGYVVLVDVDFGDLLEDTTASMAPSASSYFQGSHPALLDTFRVREYSTWANQNAAALV